jgi:hypothetical protein
METLSLLAQAPYDRHLTVDTARRIPPMRRAFSLRLNAKTADPPDQISPMSPQELND